MRIAATQYSGKHRALEIYVAGCKGPDHCPGCHNPELWNFDNGSFYDDTLSKFILTKIHLFDQMIDRIWILGGEPGDQNIGCIQHLLTMLNRTGKEIWYFTRYDLSQVPEDVLAKCSYIKCGQYDQNLKADNYLMYDVSLASTNQKIYKRGFDY